MSWQERARATVEETKIWSSNLDFEVDQLRQLSGEPERRYLTQNFGNGANSPMVSYQSTNSNSMGDYRPFNVHNPRPPQRSWDRPPVQPNLPPPHVPINNWSAYGGRPANRPYQPVAPGNYRYPQQMQPQYQPRMPYVAPFNPLPRPVVPRFPSRQRNWNPSRYSVIPSSNTSLPSYQTSNSSTYQEIPTGLNNVHRPALPQAQARPDTTSWTPGQVHKTTQKPALKPNKKMIVKQVDNKKAPRRRKNKHQVTAQAATASVNEITWNDVVSPDTTPEATFSDSMNSPESFSYGNTILERMSRFDAEQAEKQKRRKLPRLLEPEKIDKALANDGMMVLNDILGREKTAAAPVVKCMVCKIVLLEKFEERDIKMCKKCKLTNSDAGSSGNKKKDNEPFVMPEGYQIKLDSKAKIVAEMRKVRLEKKSKVNVQSNDTSSDDDSASIVNRKNSRRYSEDSEDLEEKRRRVAKTIRKEETADIRSAPSGLYTHSIKPLPRPSRSLSTDSDEEKKSQLAANAYKSRLTVDFPNEKDLKYDDFHAHKTCVNCDEELPKERREYILCQNCKFWNHVYCVDEGYYESRYKKQCFYCQAMEEKAGKVEIVMDKSKIGLEDPDTESDEELPQGKAKDFRLYFNMFKKSNNIKVGDLVYVKKRSKKKSDKSNVELLWVHYLLKDKRDRKFIYGIWVMRPQDITQDHKQDFYEKEVFPAVREGTDDIGTVPLENAVGFAAILERRDYFEGRPRGMMLGEDVFVYEYYFDVQERNHSKAKNRYSDYFKINKNEFAWKKFDTEYGVLKRKLFKYNNTYKDLVLRVEGDTLAI